jgi:uncharacterized membrane protein YcaP (DUF421 family)
MTEIFEWNRLLYNDLPESFLLEVIFRSTIMFTVLLLTLKVAGKRGVKQYVLKQLSLLL